ncbi:MAG: TIGR03000 domain-containing protein [Planctomycetota bacterium]|nr:TIGR03000 domain-containing protein [Planctomycetota bacterium]
MRLVWGGVLAAGLLGASAPNAHAQSCGCMGASQGMVYESGMPTEVNAEALLQTTVDPSKEINLTVVVQDKAIVTINGEETYTKGTVRPYIVRGLQQGKEYNFVIEALLKNEAGAHFTAKQSVKIKAGGPEQVVVLKLSRTNRPPVVPPVVPPVIANAAPAAK